MILLLSDNPDTAHRLQDDLEPEGFPITVVDGFSKAIWELEKSRDYHIVLVDFELSNEDAFEVCEKIKRSPQMKLLPLIGILDRSRIVDQLLAFEMGVDDFIYMPHTTLEIQLKIRSLQRIIQLQKQLQQKNSQVEQLRNIQRVMVTLNHYINNALTPLYFAVQIMDETDLEESIRIKTIARETVEFISKVLQSLHKVVHEEKIRVLQEGIYKDMMFDIEKELNQLLEKTR